MNFLLEKSMFEQKTLSYRSVQGRSVFGGRAAPIGDTKAENRSAPGAN